MLQAMRKHMRSNAGDSHVSKMTIIAIVFVVGAILLVLTTSAFRNPVNNWFSKVTAGWFADENGMFEADNPLMMYPKNPNGTYQNAKYVSRNPNGYWVLECASELVMGGEVKGYYFVRYNQQGERLGTSTFMAGTASLSDDGMVLTVSGYTFEAEFE